MGHRAEGNSQPGSLCPPGAETPNPPTRERQTLTLATTDAKQRQTDRGEDFPWGVGGGGQEEGEEGSRAKWHFRHILRIYPMKGKALWGRGDQQVAKAQEGEKSGSTEEQEAGVGGRGTAVGRSIRCQVRGLEVNAQVQ